MNIISRVSGEDTMNRVNMILLVICLSQNMMCAGGIHHDIHDAIKNNNVLLVKSLLEKKSNLNAKDDMGYEPIQRAAYYGNIDIVKLLIGKGADVNSHKKFQESALHFASRKCFVDIAHILLEHGADPNSKGCLYHTPLDEASVKGCVKIVELLFKYDADVNTEYPASWKWGVSVLHRVCLYKHYEVAQLLISHGADVNAKSNNKETPLMWAVCYTAADYNFVKLLIDHGADVSAKNLDGESALSFAQSLNHEDIVKLILKTMSKDEINVIHLLGSKKQGNKL